MWVQIDYTDSEQYSTSAPIGAVASDGASACDGLLQLLLGIREEIGGIETTVDLRTHTGRIE